MANTYGVTVITLACTGEEFNKLWSAIHHARSDTDYVMVNRDALKHLLYDHSQVIASYTDDMGSEWLRFEDGDREAQDEAVQAFTQYADVILEKENE